MKQPRVKRLNIYNTDRYFNIHLMKREEITRKIKVNRLNEQQIEAEMDELRDRSKRMPVRNDKSYLLYQEKYNNDTLIKKLLTHAGSVSYYTDSIVPYYILQQLAKNLTSDVVYPVKPQYTSREIENVVLSYMACPVTIDCPVVLPDISPYDILFALHPLKTNVDKVQISFPWLTEEEIQDRHQRFYHKVQDSDGTHWEVLPKYKYEFFKHVQVSLSIWAMNIWLVCDSDEDYDNVNYYVLKEQAKRSANRERALLRKERVDG